MRKLALLAIALLAGCTAPVAPGPASVTWHLDCYRTPGWSDPCTTRASAESGPANENWLALNPKDARNLMVGGKDYNPNATDCVWVGLATSHDSGATWKDQYIGGLKAQRSTDPTLGPFTCNTDPMFAFADDGFLYDVVEVYGSGPGSGIGDPLGIGQAIEGQGHNTMFIVTSSDGGTTFGPPVLVSAPDAKFNIPAAITAGDDGRVLAFWLSSDGFGTPAPADLWVAASTDDGATFGAPVHVAQTNVVIVPNLPNAQFYVANNPQIAVDRSGGPRQGWAYAVWDLNVSGHLDPRISVSRDGGATWSEPRSVSGDPDAHDRFHPALAVDAWGGVHVAYNDRRYDPANKLMDLTWAIAPDGLNFTSFRVTNSSFDGDLGFHQTGVPFIGDYNGLACMPKPGPEAGVCYASWADTRDGRSELAVAKLVRG
ncbi:MAG: glycoside hydrolase [Halobacteriales archaeon]|nr:glycoside hydrolase [Halobacteriales archaeon]